MPQSATIDELMARFAALTHGGAPRERKPTPTPPRRAAAAPPPAPAARPNSFQPPALPPPGHPAGDQGSPQAKARKERSPSAPVPLRMLTPADCARAEPRGYTIKGMIAPADVAIVFGQPGAGKSVIAPHLGYAVAQGDAVFGRRVKPGVVFYVAAEDPHGMKGRVHGLRLERGDAPDFRLIEGVRDLLSEDSPDRDALLDLIREHKPRLVIIDTIAAAFPGLQENDAEAMGRVVGYARDITATRAACMLVHHTPKAEGSTTPRGHGSLFGDADVALQLDRSGAATGDAIFGQLRKNRNGPSGAALSFTIASVRIGRDDDGDPITAPVLVEGEAGAVPRDRLSDQQRKALQFLCDLVASEGQPLPSGGGFPSAAIMGTQESRWRAECDSRRLSGAEQADSRAASFKRAFEKLQALGRVAARSGWVWPLSVSPSDP